MKLRPARTLYVHSSGSDANSGRNPKKPKATLASALTGEAIGDTVIMLPHHVESITVPFDMPATRKVRPTFLVDDLKRALKGDKKQWLRAAKKAGYPRRIKYLCGDGQPVYYGWTRKQVKAIMEVAFAERGRRFLKRAGV